MITNRNNFRAYLRRQYPDVIPTSINNLPLLLIDKPLSDMDMYQYNIQQLTDGKYIVFFGISPGEAKELFLQIKQDPHMLTQTRRNTLIVPTTFVAVENWLDRHNILYKERTYCANKTPQEILDPLHEDGHLVKGTAAPLQPGTWYLYDLNTEDFDEEQLCQVPHVVIDNRLMLLAKASSSHYKSKRQRFLDKFQFMMPLYEQAISSCATACEKERNDEKAEDDWKRAQYLCVEYMRAQFSITGTRVIDIDKMKEAYHEGTLSLFLRDPENLHQENIEEWSVEDSE